MAQLNSDQYTAYQKMELAQNVFVTGVAGSGKTFLITEFLKNKISKEYPIVASTGTAALLAGGRTFHSFFGLGILEGGKELAVQRALKDGRVRRRLKEAKGLIIDEISMLPEDAFSAAEEVCRMVRDFTQPWGGLQIIAVGDFAQLPPVRKNNQPIHWLFDELTWKKSKFEPILLKNVERTKDAEFLKILNYIRRGNVNSEVIEFLNEKGSKTVPEDVTRIYPRKVQTEKFNNFKLSELDGTIVKIPTQYSGDQQSINTLKKWAPIPEVLILKTGALVMLRQNDPKFRWVNGSTGRLVEIEDDYLLIELKNGNIVEVQKTSFSMLDADGEPRAIATNFPVNLAYACTIHKAQGATLDEIYVSLSGLWESGQSYVALSRVRSPQGIYIEDWDERSIKTDERVLEFYDSLL